ncbi:hypothetical protein [Sulfitobacter sp. R18_1]|uniref:hypothetical protein n=1 Tax=Sulfitobacter sp. R18_1 TaxID=2821104 RepID=UPI001AD96620|nr:hypothetical protein [Sulfitobacter sp. R18_1]MBO9432359.1 hypothetical protein [Sulfitobacter sp. R18_1]
MSFLLGSEKSSTKAPDWWAEPAREMLQRSIDIGKAGHMPYAGPQVAAFDPAQVAAMQNNANAANAFGMESALPNVLQATDYGNGISGYSSLPLFDQQMDWMKENRPGQLDFYNSFFVDPVTGENGTNMGQTFAQQQAQPFFHDGPANERGGSPGHGGRGGGFGLGDIAGAVGDFAGDVGDIAGGDFWGGW